MLAALIAGERDPKALAQLARRRMRSKITALQEAFTGYFTDHHAFLLARMLARVDAIDADIAAPRRPDRGADRPVRRSGAQLDEIPGINLTAAHAILAEIGTDMTRFPTAGHLVSWAKFAPGVKESGGQEERQEHHRPRQPLPGPGARQRRRRRRPHRHLPRRALPAHRPPPRRARKPSSPSAGPSWSSSGTCSPTPTPASPTSDRTSTPPASTPTAASATTSASSKPSATTSPSNPPPDQPRQPYPAPLRSAGCCRLPGNSPIFGLAGDTPATGATERSHSLQTPPDSLRSRPTFAVVSGSPPDSPRPVQTPCPCLGVKCDVERTPPAPKLAVQKSTLSSS